MNQIKQTTKTVTVQKKQNKPKSVPVQRTVTTFVNTKSNKNKSKKSQSRKLPRNYFHKYFSHENNATQASVHRITQSLFYPTHGIHRGISNGFETTALANIQGSADVGIVSSTDTIMRFTFLPALFATPVVSGNPNFINIVSSADASAPLWTIAGAIGGPFLANNPSTSARIVSATLTIIPSGALMSRSGEGKIGYGSRIGTTVSDYARDSVDNLAISQAWDGLNSMCLHWVPGVDEQIFRTGLWSSQIDFSGFVGYLIFPTNANLSFRFEWQIGIEYLPTTAYRPYVDRHPSDNTFDSYYYVNRILTAHWSPLMIDTLDGYRARNNMVGGSSYGGRLGQFITGAGASGVGFNNAANADVLQDVDDSFETMAPENSYASKAGRMFCDGVTNLTGLDMCGDPIGSGLTATTKVINAITRRGNAGGLRITM